MKIEFCHFGNHLGTRFAASSIREKIVLSFNDTDRFIFDFTGVETVSNSFADECFAKLIFDFDFQEIKNKTSYQNATPFIKTVIANAFKERLSQVEV